jgi:sec-independent protein translocase protein TatC
MVTPSLVSSRPPDPDDENRGTMGFLDHLEELRARLIRSCLAIGAGMAIAFVFRDRIADIVLRPTLNALPKGTSLVATRMGETFAFYLDIALIGGVILAAPYVLFQVWRFIAPGLHAHERQFAVPFVLMASACTIAGALFTHYVLFPSTIEFFAQFDSTSIKLTPKLEDTFGLYRSMMLGMVAVFQLPTLVFFLSLVRIVTARWLVRHIQYAIFASFVVAALLTASTDPWNQTIMAAPMIALYLVSIVVAWLVGLRIKGEISAEDAKKLRLVFTATVADQVRRAVETRQRRPGPVLWTRRGNAEISRRVRS